MFMSQIESLDEKIEIISVQKIASRSLSSGAHSRDPLARNDEGGAAVVPAKEGIHRQMRCKVQPS